MERRILQQYLGQSDDLIDEATERLERQRRIVVQLREGGEDTQPAEELLAQFERSFQMLRADRELILRLLEVRAKKFQQL